MNRPSGCVLSAGDISKLGNIGAVEWNAFEQVAAEIRLGSESAALHISHQWRGSSIWTQNISATESICGVYNIVKDATHSYDR